MKKVFTHTNSLIVANAQNLLSVHRVKSELFNQFASGGAGELSAIDSWPEIWVDGKDYEKAIQFLKPFNASIKTEQWMCHTCGEKNESTFDFCWNCQAYS